jgi:hypothetical protein
MSDNLKVQIAQYDSWKLELKVHDTVDELFDAFKACMFDQDYSDEEVEIVGETRDHNGNEGVITEDGMRKEIETTGLWGFVVEGAVHVWADLKKISFAQLLFFFGHEIGHTIPDSELSDEDPLRDEQRADGYAFAAIEAHRLATMLQEIKLKLV